MSQQAIVLKIFEYVLLLFSLSFHEAAHAWTASRLGDQTARMLGRITLNPAKHIDPIGTVLLPLAMLFLGPFGGNLLVGWARPTPINTRNFRKYVRDDVLTTLAGPVSNLLLAVLCTLALVVLKHASPVAHAMVGGAALGGGFDPQLMSVAPAIFPAVLLLYLGLQLNLVLAVFNLLPLPPLDGSHLIRHLLPTRVLQYYDRLGMIGLVLVFIFGAQFIGALVAPMIAVVNQILLVM
jgi:Zn-dependent protease